MNENCGHVEKGNGNYVSPFLVLDVLKIVKEKDFNFFLSYM